MVLLVASPAHAALSNDGTATVEYSGNFAQSFVYQQSDPAVWQESMHVHWDEKATYQLSGRAEHNPTVKLVNETLTLGGGQSDTYAPPNASNSCSATFSKRPGAPNDDLRGVQPQASAAEGSRPAANQRRLR